MKWFLQSGRVVVISAAPLSSAASVPRLLMRFRCLLSSLFLLYLTLSQTFHPQRNFAFTPISNKKFIYEVGINVWNDRHVGYSLSEKYSKNVLLYFVWFYWKWQRVSPFKNGVEGGIYIFSNTNLYLVTLRKKVYLSDKLGRLEKMCMSSPAKKVDCLIKLNEKR